MFVGLQRGHVSMACLALTWLVNQCLTAKMLVITNPQKWLISARCLDFMIEFGVCHGCLDGVWSKKFIHRYGDGFIIVIYVVYEHICITFQDFNCAFIITNLHQDYSSHIWCMLREYYTNWRCHNWTKTTDDYITVSDLQSLLA